MSDAPHAITRLTLEQFRNYASLTLDVPARPVVLTGHNGAGKTNILEAISLLSPGRGLRGAKLRGIDRIGTAVPWVVAAEVLARGEMHRLGTGRDPESSMEKRILKINGQRERKQAVLTQYICVQWLTPSLDQVFIEGGTARRKLLDRLTYSFDPEHAARVGAYELSMRERNRLLAQGRGADTYWLSVLEQQMAEHAIAITMARLDAIQRIREAFNTIPTSFTRAAIALQGAIETWLGEGLSALETETKFAERLMYLRVADALSGRAGEGPHRSYFEVMHTDKAMLAEQCSTGEQKAILLALVIAAAIARASWCGLPPILLLDEVVAHLDVDKRGALFDLIREARIQAWMTGTDAADFQGLEGFATHLEIAGGTVSVGVEK
jgi:DNA replication and repair protein RecF